MSWPWFATGAVAGVIWAQAVCVRLADRAYRHEEERDWTARELRPLVIPMTALLSGILAGRAPALGTPFWLVPLAVLAVCVPLCVVDLDVRRLPNRWLLPAIPLTFALTLAAAAWTGEWGRMPRVLIAVPVATLAYGVLWLVGGGTAFGMGDVKLAGLLAVPLSWLGTVHLVLGLLSPFIIGGLVAAGLLLTRRAQRKTPIPFGPFMVLGALATLALA